MASGVQEVETDVIVIGAGISGVATAKCLQESGFSVVLLERTGDVGGLWTFKENAYGVMKFTHINVSKHNYCFSDYPFPDDTADFPHNQQMAQYVQDYVTHFQVDKLIKFHREVVHLDKSENGWLTRAVLVEEDNTGNIKHTPKEELYKSKFVAIATGHHAKPTWPKFSGQETFTGEAIHSVSYKDVKLNKMEGKRIVIVGIGNSAVDVACNAAAVGRCKPVYLSSRSGAWVVPNYVFGSPVDHYACRLFLWLPWRLGTFVLENVIKLINGNPKKYNLNPKMHALQTQPTVSPTLIHHIQRQEIKVVPNIERIDGNKVYFTDGQSTEADCLVFCTGYKIDLPYMSDDVRSSVLDNTSNEIKLYKNVFSPSIGAGLAFIGFVQPASGGVLTMSEIQARWFAELCKGSVSLPDKNAMENSIQADLDVNAKRYFKSARHTIQKDPILYNDDIASMIGAKPTLSNNPGIAWRLILGSCGAYQWRLQGPHAWDGAERQVCRVPVTGFILYACIALIILLTWFFINSFHYFLDEILDIDFFDD